ncbi:MAG: PucR family transcriptional regulator ligand-binding domain-containing protein [Anaerovoracaceae bacterium]
MALTVKDVLHLEIMKNFRIVAGAKGINKPVKETEILDFEFVGDFGNGRRKVFNGESIVLTSLLFAKDNPSEILEAVKKLKDLNVSAMAYKPVIFKELPQEVLDFANRSNFPILSFGDDEFFEDVILAVKEQTRKETHISEIELIIKDMIARELSQGEAYMAHEKINPYLKGKIRIACVKSKDETEDDILSTLKRINISEKLKQKTEVCKYEDCYLIILSQEENDEARFKALLEDVFVAYNLNENDLIIGYSETRPLDIGFDKTVREAYWAKNIAVAEKARIKRYADIGTYKLIVPQINSANTINYMKDYLRPLFAEDEKDGELLKTAVEYVLSKGDVIKAAERLFCHKNTIRYRIGKLQEKLDPTSNEKEFYENLSIAIKIYMLSNRK